jgi:lysozyme family protein
MSFFEEVAFPWVIGIEKGFQNDPEDPGNWTGGAVGSGRLVGTKYGVSAKAYPYLDIQNLTLEHAQQIAKNDYWDKFQGDHLPAPVSLSVFDFGYNAGVHEGVVVLQRTLDLPEDGVVGPITLSSLSTRDPRWVAKTYYVERVLAYRQMKNWAHDGNGWSARAAATRDKALSL